MERLAGQLSDDLLTAETRCFVLVYRAFARQVPRELPLKTVRGIRNSQAARNGLVRAHAAAVAGCREPVSKLAGRAVVLSLASIGRELTVLEGALPKRYAGIASQAVDGVPTAAIVEDTLATYDDAVRDLPRRYRAAQTRVLATADNLPDLQVALFGRKPPRGVWWPSYTTVQQQARVVSITVANQVRLEAMRRFNQAGES